MTTVLAIESSCDETGVGIVQLHNDGSIELLANELASSVDEHTRYGGVVPEVASRAHLEALPGLMSRALQKAKIQRPDAIAVTIGPGLAGALLVGVAAAKGYAGAWNIPLYAVNHLGGHLAADIYAHGRLSDAVGLLISGGHTHLVRIRSLDQPICELGTTLDDAAGEAYDKVARLLGLGYPGGRVLDELAHQGNPEAIPFPRPLTNHGEHRYNFSFSGLKTAVVRYIENNPQYRPEDVAASFQEAVADVLTTKAIRAAQDEQVDTLVIAGGVAANSRVGELAQQRCDAAGICLRIPPRWLCTDNAAMTAAFAAQLIHAGHPSSPLDVATYPNLPITCSLVNTASMRTFFLS